MSAKLSSIDAGFGLWRAAMRWQRTVDEALRPIGLTHTQYLVLATTRELVGEARDAVTQGAIAKRAGLDEPTVSRVARALSDRGLLDRNGGLDARAYRIVLSRKGARAATDALTRLEVALKGVFVYAGPHFDNR